MNEKQFELRIKELEIKKNEDGYWYRVINCSKCNNVVKVLSANQEDLFDLSKYVCAECRGVYEKFGGRPTEKELEESKKLGNF